jgi:hypothetical protein
VLPLLNSFTYNEVVDAALQSIGANAHSNSNSSTSANMEKENDDHKNGSGGGGGGGDCGAADDDAGGTCHGIHAAHAARRVVDRNGFKLYGTKRGIKARESNRRAAMASMARPPAAAATTSSTNGGVLELVPNDIDMAAVEDLVMGGR